MLERRVNPAQKVKGVYRVREVCPVMSVLLDRKDQLVRKVTQAIKDRKEIQENRGHKAHKG